MYNNNNDKKTAATPTAIIMMTMIVIVIIIISNIVPPIIKSTVCSGNICGPVVSLSTYFRLITNERCIYTKCVVVTSLYSLADIHYIIYLQIKIKISRSSNLKKRVDCR